MPIDRLFQETDFALELSCNGDFDVESFGVIKIWSWFSDDDEDDELEQRIQNLAMNSGGSDDEVPAKPAAKKSKNKKPQQAISVFSMLGDGSDDDDDKSQVSQGSLHLSQRMETAWISSLHLEENESVEERFWPL